MSLDQVLADTFRAARAAFEPGGWPSCPSGFDSVDVYRERRRSRANPCLHIYRCRCCHRMFSDLYVTPMENTNAPLRIWAILLFTTPRNAGGPSSYALERRLGLKHHRIRAIQAKLKDSPFAACWKAELEKAGVTAERLLKAGGTVIEIPQGNFGYTVD